MRLQFLFLFSVSLLYKDEVNGDAQCILDNGRCTYKVQLLDGCRDNLLPVQNDDRKINDIEQTLHKVKLEHSKMISELENKINQLVSSSSISSNSILPNVENIRLQRPQYVSSFGSSGDRSVGDLEEATFEIPDNPERQENQLLYSIHDEFSLLRKELVDTKRKLREKEKLLDLTRLRFNKSETDAKRKLTDTEKQLNLTKLQLNQTESLLKRKTDALLQTEDKLTQVEIDAQFNLLQSEKVLNVTRSQLQSTETALQEKTDALRLTEDKLTQSENRRVDLKKLANRKQNEVNTIREKLRNCKKEVKSKDINIWELTSDVDKLRKELELCKEELAQVKNMLQKALIKYHELNHKHENVTLELNETKFQLMHCSKGNANMYCGFEDPLLCGYTVETGTHLLEWIQWTMTTPSDRTGPTGDHTCGNDYGHYMYVEATTMGAGRRARLISPIYNGYQAQCVEFYYHMYGQNTGTLNVILLVENAEPGDFSPPVWRASGNQGNVWTMARLTVPEQVAVKNYQVVFEVMTDNGYAGDIAIDDVRIFDGECYGAQSIDQWRKIERNKQIDLLRKERERLQNKNG